MLHFSYWYLIYYICSIWPDSWSGAGITILLNGISEYSSIGLLSNSCSVPSSSGTSQNRSSLKPSWDSKGWNKLLTFKIIPVVMPEILWEFN